MGLAQKSSNVPSANSKKEISSKKKEEICIQEGETYKVRTSGIIGDTLLFASKNHSLKISSIVDKPCCKDVNPYIEIYFEGWIIRTTKSKILSIISNSSNVKPLKRKKKLKKKRA